MLAFTQVVYDIKSFSRLNFNDIEAKVNSSVYSLQNHTKPKSSCWSTFQFVIKENGETLKVENDFVLVRCRLCSSYKKFKKSQGTSNLVSHAGTCSITNSANHDDFGEVTFEEKETFKRACVQYCAIDLRPFHSVSTPGQRNLLQTVADLQFKRTSRINIEELAPHPTTVSRNVAIEEENIKSKIIAYIKANLDPNRFSFTMDIWTDIGSEVSIYIFTFLGDIKHTVEPL